MSGDKRTVATDALDTLGTAPLDDTAKRDAIHLAVEPVIAGERLAPGEHVTVEGGVAYWSDAGNGLGIVDPFLSRHIRKGERFWFVMYPRTIKSLRHVWAHPAFPDEAGTTAGEPELKTDEVPAGVRAARRKESEKWLRSFVDRSDCPSYEAVIAAVSEGYFSEGESLHFRGNDAHGEIPPEFWTHAEIVLGRKIEDRPTHFSCSC